MRPFVRRLVVLVVASMTGLLTSRVHADLVDSVNPNAQSVPNTDYGPDINGIGWYYTPTISYTLTGISSRFQAIGQFGTGSRTITVQIQSERPINSGKILGQGTFIGDSVTGGTLGASFAAVQLTAGTRYFVDFLNISGMSINLGQWTTAPNGTHIATAGATTRFSDVYENRDSDVTFSTDRSGTSADESLATGNSSAFEPILFFNGVVPAATVPEPSSLALSGLAGLVALSLARLKRRGQ